MNSFSERNNEARRGWILYLAFGAFLAAAFYLSTQNYLLFHTLSEVYTITISFTIALIVVNSYQNLYNDFMPLLGITCAFSGGFALLHALAYNGLGIFADGSGIAMPMWIIAGLLGSFGMFLACLSLHRPISPPLVLAIYSLLSALALAAVFYWQVFPLAGQELTLIIDSSEYAIALILVAGIVVLVAHRSRFHPRSFVWLLIFYVASIGAELSDTLNPQVYEWQNVISHLFKITAYYFLYRAIAETSIKEPVNALFFQLNQTNNLLKEKEARLVEAQRLARVGNWEWDHEKQEFVWSDQIYINLGYGLNEVCPSLAAFIDRVHPDDKARIEEYLEECRHKDSCETEFRIIRPGDGEAWLHLRAHSIFDATRQPLKYFGTLQDISERKRSEARLQRYALDLADSNREIKNYANAMSHDFRTPLVNLKGFAAELSYSLADLKQITREECGWLPPDRRTDVDVILDRNIPEALQFIETAVDKMDRMIVALLKLARMDRRELRQEEVDMTSLFSLVLQSFEHQIKQRHIRVEVGPLPRIVTDYGTMVQIIGNLLDNAIKYLEPGRSGEIAISCTGCGDEYHFCIRDNGRGISADDQGKIFEFFQRAGRHETPGEGMGLAYVRASIRSLGGRVWCESTFGVGTKMCFSLPRSSPPLSS